MDCTLGIVGKGFTLLAADTSVPHSIIVVKDDQDKIMKLDDKKAMALAGPNGDVVNLGEYIQKNIALYELSNGVKLSTHAAANFVRGEMASALRSRNMYQVFVLLGGYDESGPSLYWMDYLASMAKVEYGAHGYGSYFALSILDRLYKPDMSVDEAVHVLQTCIAELKTRFLIDQKTFLFKIIDENGVRVFDPSAMQS